MNNQDIREVLLKELDLTGIPSEAQDQVISKLGEIILKSLVVTIYEHLLPDARKEFDAISASGNQTQIQEFLEQNIPRINELMEAEISKTINAFKDRGGNK
ncbi:MAG: hypothetical protein AAB552_02555 [Patescibacteria group bacterium]